MTGRTPDIDHVFADPRLLTRALTHASAGDGGKRRADNERLEFLGDRVLGLLAAEALYARFVDAREGALAKRLNAIVNKAACARAARRAGIGPALVMSRGEENAGGRDKDAILADAIEAVMAALYLDGGLPAARAFFLRHWAGELDAVQAVGADPKTALQEEALARWKQQPAYVLVARDGPDHAPRFIARAVIAGRSAEGEGGSKQEAERAAAARLLEALHERA